MDDFTKKDKYSSLHSAIRDVVGQNRNLHQESTNAKYGIQKEQPVEQTEVNEDVEQIDENIISKMKQKIDKLMNREDFKKIAEIRSDISAAKWYQNFYNPGGRKGDLYHWTDFEPDTPENKKTIQKMYDFYKKDYADKTKQFQVMKDKMRKKGIEIE